MAAEVTLSNQGKIGRSKAFQLLFSYVSGANSAESEADKIAMTVPIAVREPELVAMTAPVESSEASGTMRMRFFLPAKYSAKTAPLPLDDRVRIVTVPEQTIAILRFSGSGVDAAARQSELIATLAKSDWQPIMAPYTLYYDAPFTIPFLRRNEAAVIVDERS